MFKFKSKRNKLTQEERQFLSALIIKEAKRLRHSYMKSASDLTYKRIQKLDKLLEKVSIL